MHLNIQGVTPQNELARDRANQLADSLLQAGEAHDIAERQMAKIAEHYDKKRTEIFFNIRDKVMVSSKNIRMLRASRKLTDQNIGPFTVLERIGRNAYRLDLPKKYGQLHPTFYVSLLHTYRRRSGRETPEPVNIDDEEEWEVEQILATRERQGRPEYYVRWKGFSEAHDSWEPEEHLRNARGKLDEFHREQA
ncbi:hypothetical protein FOPE_02955 [Fonsecaea pedrosoi]|nr:hypothetical protein FOPE_02955 [Fonsecaea pedrosoi]